MSLPTRRSRRRVAKEKEAAVSSADVNKALVRRFLEAQARVDLQMFDELMAPGFVGRSLSPGRRGNAAIMEEERQA
jgi:hypothetical protein